MSRPAIFVSYRRRGDAAAVGRICDRLIDRFGSSSVFQDVNDIPAGADFGVHILEKIKECRVLLAMIDPHWGTSVLGKQHGRDWIREELEAAKHLRLHIVPVLLSNAKLPLENELPEGLRWLTSLEAIKVRNDRDFQADIQNLVEQLSQHVPTASNAKSAAAELWQELKDSEDVDALERFVETFNNTREAYDARRRLRHLKPVLAIRERMRPYDYWDELPEAASLVDFDLKAHFFETLQLVDDFLDAPSNGWSAEVERKCKYLHQLARDYEPYEGFGSDYHGYLCDRDERKIR